MLKDDINYQPFLLSHTDLLKRTFDAVYQQFDPEQPFDAFSFAWDRGQQEFKTAVMFIAYRTYPQSFNDLIPASPSGHYDSHQRKILHTISKTVTRQGILVNSMIDTTADFYQGLLYAHHKGTTP